MRVSVTLLQYDHGLIRQVVEILAEVVRSRKAENNLEITQDLVTFQERFTDALHHRKEERFLFPAAVQIGALTVADHDALIADHDRARQGIKGMETSLRSNDIDSFYIKANAYCEMMLHHIHLEEEKFFPFIEERMDADLDTEIFKRFDEFLAKNFPPDVYPRSEAFADRAQDEVLGPGYFEKLH